MENGNITVRPYPVPGETFMGLFVPKPCVCCGRQEPEDLWSLEVKDHHPMNDDHGMVLCTGCLERMRESISMAFREKREGIKQETE